jgi:hypothetical protein
MAPKNPAKSAPRARALQAESESSSASTAVDESAALARTEGQRLLRLLPHSLAVIGSAVGVTKQAVAFWRGGDKLPEERARRRLQAEYGIPVETWGRAPLLPELDDDDEDEDAGTEEPSENEPEDEGEIDVMHELGKLARQQRRSASDSKLTARERQAAQAELSRTLQTLARLRREHELSEGRYVRQHPAWIKMRTVVLRALLPHKEAARDVEAALRALEDDDAPPLTDEELDG